MEMVRVRRRLLSRLRTVSSMFTILLVILFVVYINLPPELDLDWIRCTEYTARERLQNTCELYRKRLITGKLCPALCDEKTVRFKLCVNHIGGKISLLVDCEGVCSSGNTVDAFLKSTIKSYNGIVSQGAPRLANDAPINTLDELRAWVNDKVNATLGRNDSYQGDVIQRVFDKDYQDYIESSGIKAFIVSVWSLVQQDEYLMIKLHQHSPIFPKIYHSCGSLYLLESAPPGPILQPSLNPLVPDRSTWKERVNVALKVLDAVKVLDNGFPQTLHMCDTKGENFGLSSDGYLKPIDPDDLIIESKLFDMYKNKDPCLTDKDCDYKECLGICEEGKCLIKRQNNNLQGACNLIFTWGYSGKGINILRYPPASISQQLADILQRCVKWSDSIKKPDELVANELRQLLLSSV